ncbi:MAG: hypothetical protein H0V44_13340 [Planctomycetes bacterium]|nr:hypothetical protein [Planctomycetota bacterium]
MPEADAPPARRDDRLPLHLQRLRHLSWEGFSFVLPPGWEITAYSLDAKNGQFQFFERGTFRAQLVWRKVPKAPDLPRILNEIHRRQLEKDAPGSSKSFSTLEFAQIGRFLVGHDRPGLPCQASLFQPDRGLLIQWVFPSYDPGDFITSWMPLLDSFAPNDAAEMRWELFGLSLRLPRSMTFEEITPDPANVALSFETRKHAKLVARRMGLPTIVLAGTSLARVHARILERAGSRILSCEDLSMDGHRAVRTRFDRRGMKGMEKLVGGWWPGDAWIWHDEIEGRIYAIEQFGPRKQIPIELSAIIRRDGP